VFTTPLISWRTREHYRDFGAAGAAILMSSTNLIAACSRPGVSIALVALANGINANLLRRWIEQSGQRSPGADPGDTNVDMPRDHAKAAFVPVQLDATPSPTALDREQARKKIKERAGHASIHSRPSLCRLPPPGSLLLRRGQDGPHNQLRSTT